MAILMLIGVVIRVIGRAQLVMYSCLAKLQSLGVKRKNQWWLYLAMKHNTLLLL